MNIQNLIGQDIQIQSQTEYNSDFRKPRFNMSGKLEYFDGEYYVRVGQHVLAGAMGVAFRREHVILLKQQKLNWLIVLQ